MIQRFRLEPEPEECYVSRVVGIESVEGRA
jgi:hypothetical protein